MMTDDDKAKYQKLAREIVESSIVTAAHARLVEQVIAEIHEYKIKPLERALREAKAAKARA